MPHTLSVTVHVDLDLKEVQLAVAGCLTAETHPSLLPIVRQAQGLEPAPRITLDLTGAGHIDLDGLVPLRHALEREALPGTETLSYRLPDPLPVCRRTVAARRPTGTAEDLFLDGAGREAPLALLRSTEAPSRTPSAPAPSAEAPERTARSRSRREEILAGAAEMFAEHGYHGASLRDISRHIGISHPGLMHHFASKDILLDSVIDLLEAHARRILDQVETMHADPAAMLRALSVHWDPAALPTQLLATLGAESVSGDHPGRFRMARLRRVHEHVFEQCFLEFRQRNLLRPGLDPAFASRAMFGLVLNLAVRERTVRTMQGGGHDDAPIEELTRLARSFVESGASH
ncbi:MAG TPA: TetR/AcrR family transcriptional regulator [Brachybacterium massiliense]|uniref:TetR/AcrR family transcriptional regulator n=1 Tax=Brachybacterium massiliense TaxID=1755098 RepID=A0A921MV58_9MICO|nr:TetR/AcrR family transcriptional regulator [Brachybacterium massiliense]